MAAIHSRFVRSVLLLCIMVLPLVGLAANQKAASQTPDLHDMVLIPAGEFIMGSNLVDTNNVSGEYGNVKPWYLDEHPRHTVTLPAYYIEEHEVTNGQFLQYLKASDDLMPEYWIKNGYIIRQHVQKLQGLDIDRLRHLASDIYHIDKNTLQMTREELLKDINQILDYMDTLPVTYVTWQQADHYCQWAGYHLPTEAEWEKAARGPAGQEFPWGNEWKPNMANVGTEIWDMFVAPVESYPTDKSPYGIYDLAGNVSEWVDDWYHGYEGTDYTSDDFGRKFKVVRGAGWSGGQGHYALKLFQRAAYRGNLPPDRTFDDVGFRCAVEVSNIQQAQRP